MTITLTHQGGGVAEFAPAIQGLVWYDSYFDGELLHQATLKSEDVADVIMQLMNKGYTVEV